MPLDPRAQRFLDMMATASGGKGASRDISERRAALTQLMTFARADALAPPGTPVALKGADGDLPGRVYTPDGSDGRALLPGLLFFHGGGLVAGSLDTHDVIARGLAQSSGCRVVSVGYRLAPEFPFPAAIEDAIAASSDIAARSDIFGIDPGRLALVGESGGGALAVLTAHDAATRGQRHIALLVLICPALLFDEETASRSALSEGYLIDRTTLEADLQCYAPGADRSDPRISPLRLPTLTGFPPTIIHTAEFDPLRDEGAMLAARLTEAEVNVTLNDHAGMVHNFHALGAVLPQGRAALTQIGREIADALR